MKTVSQYFSAKLKIEHIPNENIEAFFWDKYKYSKKLSDFKLINVIHFHLNSFFLIYTKNNDASQSTFCSIILKSLCQRYRKVLAHDVDYINNLTRNTYPHLEQTGIDNLTDADVEKILSSSLNRDFPAACCIMSN